MSGELIDIYDSQGRKIGLAERSQAHGDNSLLHRAAHVLVFSSDGRLLQAKTRSVQCVQQVPELCPSASCGAQDTLGAH